MKSADANKITSIKIPSMPGRFSACYITALLLVISSGICQAQFVLPRALSTTQVSLPQRTAAGGTARGSGFNAQIELTNALGAGYCNLEAVFKSTLGPTTTTRDLVIRLTPIDRHIPASRTIASDILVTFPQGQTQVTIQRAFPKWTIGNSFRIEVIEDGVSLPDYSAEVGMSLPGFAIRTPAAVLGREWVNNILMIDAEPSSNPPPADINFYADGNVHEVDTTTLENLPADWRLLREIDCIVIDQAGLADKRANVIRDWVMMGGALVVLDAPDVSDLAQQLRLTLTPPPPEATSLQAMASLQYGRAIGRVQGLRTWLTIARQRPVNPSGPVGEQAAPTIEIAETAEGIADNAMRPTAQQAAEMVGWIEQLKVAAESLQSTWQNAYRRHAGAGQVIALPSKTIDSDDSFFLLDQLIGIRKSPIIARGVDPLMGDTRTREWLIPGVAEPPVYTFMGILTLFVLLVGPVAYRWTTRGHRSHLMFLIAPLLALFTTAFMFSYSIISDGLGTKIRIRQITWIDGASGDAAERTRCTLFSGISPREGLRFAGDAEVMAYPNGGQLTWDELPRQVGEVRMRTIVENDSQRFASSVLPSRSQTQFISHQMRHGIGGLKLGKLTPLDPDGKLPMADSVEVTSTLEMELRDLVICSPDGRYWSVDRIGAGETVRAKWVSDSDKASSLLGTIYTRFAPIISVSRSGRSRRNNKIGDLILYLNREINRGGANFTSGIFELHLTESLFVKGEITPGSFMAISAPSEDVVAVQDAQQVESVRYVLGTLQ